MPGVSVGGMTMKVPYLDAQIAEIKAQRKKDASFEDEQFLQIHERISKLEARPVCPYAQRDDLASPESTEQTPTQAPTSDLPVEELLTHDGRRKALAQIVLEHGSSIHERLQALQMLNEMDRGEPLT